jgi:hypothetical protein
MGCHVPPSAERAFVRLHRRSLLTRALVRSCISHKSGSKRLRRAPALASNLQPVLWTAAMRTPARFDRSPLQARQQDRRPAARKNYGLFAECHQHDFGPGIDGRLSGSAGARSRPCTGTDVEGRPDRNPPQCGARKLHKREIPSVDTVSPWTRPERPCGLRFYSAS